MYDLIIRGGTVATAADTVVQDIAIQNGKIVALGSNLGEALQVIEAKDKIITPGGIDSHCHIEQKSSSGLMTADDFYSASRSAAFGGTTTIIPFAAQHKGQSLYDVFDDYHRRASEKSVIDYAYHLIIADPSAAVMGEQLEAMIERGVTSFKIYMTYESLKLDDYQILEVLFRARELQSLVMIHAENNDVIRWLTDKLLALGHSQPKYHAISHARIAESEATHRAISLAELLDTPLLIVHVSSAEATAEIRHAQERGLKIYGETCPQYLFLTAQDLDREGMDGAMYCCSPPPRDKASQEVIWQGLCNGTFSVFSSDHSPYRFDSSGKLAAGKTPSFDKIANGVPGLEIRLPMLFSAGVGTGRMSLNQFVAVTATNAAKMYGIYPQKGTIAVGSDADIVIWDSQRQVTLSSEMLHDEAGYTPYSGTKVTGWPEIVLSRGRVVIADNQLQVERGSGAYVHCGLSEYAAPSGKTVSELNPASNFGAQILGANND
ncbi:dihydropyrimidinase ['Osedax' symbiont bacterium Rs2_46_30_T18]|nr:dihydropyrimidinase ['Osedax' symbiont bacterium Rs2_46_30_T18]